MEGSPTEQWDANGFSATRVLRCAWSSRFTLADELLGGDSGRGALYEPKTSTGARATGIAMGPPGGTMLPISGTIAGYNNAELTVTYGNGPGDSADLVSESLEPTAEFLTLPPEKFLWGSGTVGTGVDLEEDEAPGMLIRGMDYVLTRYQVPYIPIALTTLPGKVNDATVTASLLLTSPGVCMAFAAETLLFGNPTLQRTTKTDNSPCWTINYRFSYRPSGWNKYWRSGASTPGYETLYEKGGSAYKSYPTASFAGICGALP